MVIFRIILKVALLPLIVLLAILWGIVKVIVGLYTFARGLFGLLMAALILLTLYYYQDWLQIGFLVVLSGLSFVVLAAGMFVEISLENCIARLGAFVVS